MKKFLKYTISGLLGLVAFVSCDKSSLELVNPNEPGFATLKYEEGIARLAYGVYQPLRFYNGYYYFWFVLTNHNAMGDATTVSAGNFAWRWMNQVSSVTLTGGTVVLPPSGGSQPHELTVRNTRDFGSDNVFAHEWMPLYGLIGHVNFMKSVLGDVNFTGSAAEIDIKRRAFLAWGYWWKGFAYSRIGSIFEEALIVDSYGFTNNNFLHYSAILAEATRNFEAAKAQLAGIPEQSEVFAGIMESLIPEYTRVGRGGVLTPQMFIRNINTYLARNILVNTPAAELTAAQLTQIEQLAENGLVATDYILTIRSHADDTQCLVYTSAWPAFRILVGWENLSERLVQDFRPGDNRFTRNVIPRVPPNINPRGRGLHYGTRWGLNPIENGGDFASTLSGLAEMPIACTFEENQLMLAEVHIRRGNIDEGLAYIDEVRDHQNAGLSDLEGQGLTSLQALEELRSERRIGLFFQGTSFYDARRWGILRPVAQGGGRTGAVILLADGTADTNAKIDYNYLERFPVPANETDFNPIPAPVSGSAVRALRID